MKYLVIALLTLFTPFASYGDDIGFRFGSAIPTSNNAVVQFPSGDPTGNTAGTEGKMINMFYDHDLSKNFYLEGAFGYRSPHDIDTYSSMAYELSPGAKVTWDALVMKLSEGVSYMPQNHFDPSTYTGYNALNLVTHLTIGLTDPKTGVGIAFDRSHYSNGMFMNNPSLNYTGFQISFRI